MSSSPSGQGGSVLGPEPDGTTVDPARQRRETVLGTVALGGMALLLGVVCAGWFTLPSGWRWPMVIGVVVGVVTLFLTVGGRRWPDRIALFLFGSCLTATATLWRHDVREYGVTAAIAAVFLLPAVTFAFERLEPKHVNPVTASRVLFRLLVGAVLASAALGLLGFTERGGPFAVAYGQEVELRLGDDCIRVIELGKEPRINCSGATWEVDGRTYTGYAHLADDDIDISFDVLRGDTIDSMGFTTRSVQAYVYPGEIHAYTAQRVRENRGAGLEVFGFVPPWLIAPLPPLLVFVVVRAIVRNRRRRRVA